MKITVKKALAAFFEIENLGEKRSQTGELIEKAIEIPAEKTRTSYWLGRLTSKLTTIKNDYEKQRDALVKSLGTPVVAKDENGVELKNDDGTPKYIEGQYQVATENLQKFQEQHQQLLDTEDEIELAEGLEYELFEGIKWPITFFRNLDPFIKEPK